MYFYILVHFRVKIELYLLYAIIPLPTYNSITSTNDFTKLFRSHLINKTNNPLNRLKKTIVILSYPSTKQLHSCKRSFKLFLVCYQFSLLTELDTMLCCNIRYTTD